MLGCCGPVAGCSCGKGKRVAILKQQHYLEVRHCCGQDPADPRSGRYSLRVVIPTTVPVWLPVPMLTKHAPGPLRNDTAYSFSLWVRSSPAGEHHRLHRSQVFSLGFHTVGTVFQGPRSTSLSARWPTARIRRG